MCQASKASAEAAAAAAAATILLTNKNRANSKQQTANSKLLPERLAEKMMRKSLDGVRGSAPEVLAWPVASRVCFSLLYYQNRDPSAQN
jgi:septal ring factor EnvC (AmiA/AmiB activator)